MEYSYKSYTEIEYLSRFDQMYAEGDESLRPFFKYDVNLASFKKIIADKGKEKINRSVLVNVLKEQYQSVVTSEATRSNLETLQRDTAFTVITAHQPSLFTGPLYYIYKILGAINLAEKLSAAYPENQFIPVFWLGSEDHDFEEINHAHIFGKTVQWDNEESGATGQMSTATLTPTLAELKEILGSSDNANHIFSLIEQSYTSHKTYAQATFAFINELFKKYGLVVLLANHPDLKRLFIPFMKEELIHQPSIKLVQKTIEDKEAVTGLSGQATPRDINLFYMKDQVRERIVLENGRYKVLNTDYAFTESEILQELEQYPEHFSPNVILRPVFQELITPNLAYIGGGGELAYWMERKTQFEHFGINFPMLIRRNSVLWVDKGSLKKIDQLGLQLDDFWGDVEVLIKRYVKENTDEELSLKEAKKTIAALYDSILEKATAIDPTLKKTVLGEKTKQINAVINLESRLLSAEKRNHEIAVNRIRGVKDKLFPNNGLQERYDNFINFYLKHGEGFFEVLKGELDPLNKDFVIVEES